MILKILQSPLRSGGAAAAINSRTIWRWYADFSARQPSSTCLGCRSIWPAAFSLYPYLGWILVAGAVILLSAALVTEFLIRAPTRQASRSASARTIQLEAERRNAEVVCARYRAAVDQLHRRLQSEHVAAHHRNADIVGSLVALSKMLRFILQSSLLEIGARLVMDGEARAGVMIPNSIMGYRTFDPQMDLAAVIVVAGRSVPTR